MTERRSIRLLSSKYPESEDPRLFITDKWEDFEVIYAGDGAKYERWGDIFLDRPDPQAVWPKLCEWPKPHALYNRSQSGGGSWTRIKSMPSSWKISYDSLGKKLTFLIEPTSFKHTGLFPEQAANWDFCGELIENAVKAGKKEIKILNLFAYTGGATAACACHGATETVHVDASKGMIAKAKENLAMSGLGDSYVRFIAEDCMSFVEREIRRGRKYDGIIMDPPAYGRGPKGELWKLEEALYDLVSKCEQLLSDDPLFFIISSYASEITAQASGDVLTLAVGQKHGGTVTAEELCLPVTSMGIYLPCGATARWNSGNY